MKTTNTGNLQEFQYGMFTNMNIPDDDVASLAP